MTDVSGTALFRPGSLATRIRWLLLTRTIVITVFLGATAVTHSRIDSAPDFPLREVAGLIIIAYVASLASATLLPWVRRLKLFALTQLVVDVGLISAAMLLTGGLRSPMGVWYNLVIIAAALLLFRRGAFAIATLSALSYGVLVNLDYWGALPEILAYGTRRVDPGFALVFQMGANLGSFFSIAYLSSILAERLATTEEALAVSEASRQRVETLQETLVESLESAILTTDTEGRVESANKAVTKVLDLDPSTLVGRKVVELFPVLRPPVGTKRLLDPTPIPTEIRYERNRFLPPHWGEGQGEGERNGEPETRTLRCTSAPLADTWGQPIGMLYILQDVSAMAAEVPDEELQFESLPENIAPELEGLIGRSPAMTEVYTLIRKVAPTDSTVLLTGDSGTGKELAARAIHSLSPRRHKPMVVVNCAAIPENLIESELFGHIRGAFTGAIADRRGLFRAADGGTIFLDEIGDLPLPMQVKLLRVLQERSFTPVGAQQQVAVDVRVIAATNRNLEADVASGRFREDLFYRLNVIRIEMPSLRERREDLPILIRHFLGRFGETVGKSDMGVTQGAMQRLLAYPYPGNNRELEPVIEHAVALSGPEGITEEDLPSKLYDGKPALGLASPAPPAPGGPDEPRKLDLLEEMHAKGSNLDAEIEQIERRFLEEALKQARGVRKRAAEILGINYRSLRHRLSKYGFGDADASR